MQLNTVHVLVRPCYLRKNGKDMEIGICVIWVGIFFMQPPTPARVWLNLWVGTFSYKGQAASEHLKKQPLPSGSKAQCWENQMPLKCRTEQLRLSPRSSVNTLIRGPASRRSLVFHSSWQGLALEIDSMDSSLGSAYHWQCIVCACVRLKNWTPLMHTRNSYWDDSM